jgi:hypothetical protein
LSGLRRIRNAREATELARGDSLSLWRELPDFVAWVYPKARRVAVEEMGLPLRCSPTTAVNPREILGKLQEEEEQ